MHSSSLSPLRLILLLLVSGILTQTLFSQAAPKSNVSGKDTEISDTIGYINYRQQSMDDVITDTSLNGNFYTTDQIEREWPYSMNLGYSGSPVYDPHYYLPRGAGWDIGLHAFDAYRKPFENLLFVQKGMPITKMTYIQTPRVNQSIFDAYFARTFNDLNFAVNHQRYNFTGDYLNQRSFNTLFHTGFAMDKDRWFGYFLFASEVFQQANNGGISADQFFGNPVYDNRSAFPVRFRNATGRDDDKKIRAGYMLKALRFGKYGVNTGIHLDIENRKVTMNSERPDSISYYPAYTFLRPEGFNSFIKHTSFFPGIVLEFSDSTHTSFQLRSTTGYNINRLDYIRDQRKWREFTEIGELSWRTGIVDLDAKLDLRIFNNNVYFDLHGEAETDWRGFGVTGYGSIQRTPASLIFYRQEFAGKSLWEREPPATFTQVLGGALHYSREKLMARIKLEQIFQQNINYFNSEGLPDVLHDQTVLSLQPEARFELGIFRFENQLALYLSENTVPSYPSLSGRHSLFIEDRWFQNRMHINLGFNVYWKNGHRTYYYLPYVQSFIPTEEYLNAEYRVYPFFAFRVRTFKFFVRMENMNMMWQKDRPSYDVYHYPRLDPTIRMGIEWLFRN